MECGKISTLRKEVFTMRTISKKIGRSTKFVHSYLKNPAGYLEKSVIWRRRELILRDYLLKKEIITTIEEQQTVEAKCIPNT